MRDDLAPILVCVRTTADTGDTCALCHQPVMLWDDVPARRVLICVLCWLAHADRTTPGTRRPGTLPC